MFIIGLIPHAFAAPLVHDGDPAAATAAAEARLGPGGREPVPIESLRQEAPVMLAGGDVVGCRGLSGEGVDVLTDALEQAVLYADVDAGSARLDEARDAVLCAPSPVAASALARIELLAGLLADQRGDADAARERFAMALGYDREVAWLGAFPPDRRTGFDEARAAERPEAVAVVVRPAGGATLDGDDRLEGPPGEHVAHVGGHGARVTLQAGIPDELVLPAAFPPDVLSWFDDDSRRADASALLAVGLGEGVHAVVVHDGVAWTGTTGRVDWVAHRPPPPVEPAPVPAPVPVSSKASVVPVLMTGVGGVVAVVGGALVATGQAAANARATQAKQAMGLTSYDALQTRYDSAVGQATIGYGLLGVGGAAATVGVVWTLGRAR